MRGWRVVVLLASACSSDAHLELVDAPPVHDLAPLVAAQLEKATSDGKQLLVYVGASWCEPCRYFHAAAEAGELDAQFGKLRLLVFDADRDTVALAHAGYEFDMIPLFVIPRADGQSSGRQIQGSIHGAASVGQIVPRLHALLAGKR